MSITAKDVNASSPAEALAGRTARGARRDTVGSATVGGAGRCCRRIADTGTAAKHGGARLIGGAVALRVLATRCVGPRIHAGLPIRSSSVADSPAKCPVARARSARVGHRNARALAGSRGARLALPVASNIAAHTIGADAGRALRGGATGVTDSLGHTRAIAADRCACAAAPAAACGGDACAVAKLCRGTRAGCHATLAPRARATSPCSSVVDSAVASARRDGPACSRSAASGHSAISRQSTRGIGPSYSTTICPAAARCPTGMNRSACSH